MPIIFAEHHSVWENRSGQLVDVTPPRFGVPAVLFVRDDAATIDQEDGVFLLRTDLTRWREVRRVFRGAPTELEFFPLDPANLPMAVADFVTSLDFDMSRYLTEPEIG
ncbi:hypothetical protein [Rhizobium binae]|uniref:hypothetical protein n=1 Tax=Rhizobium binae TaxID=1138190 RepID=UPI001C83AD11|nr:hypothetical protein [Rhizobium binae]MBX4967810.1 hypothetical protein [Rhizobium binae]